MTDKEQKMNELHNLIKGLYGQNTRVEIEVTYDSMSVNEYDRMNIRNYSMRRIDGTWVTKSDEN